MSQPTTTLDPSDWAALRAQSHRMLDDMLDYLSTIRERPVWQPAPEPVQETFHKGLPLKPTSLCETHALFLQSVLPYAMANNHPGFMGWVQGGGTAVGMLAEMLASGLNSNSAGSDAIPLQVEQQVTQWMRQLFEFPSSATGLLVTGSSMANLIALLVARTAKLGKSVRGAGLQSMQERLVAYASADVHSCIERALEIAGIGGNQLRKVPMNHRFEVDCQSLEEQMEADLREGWTPFCVIGTAGTANVGAIDDLARIAEIAHRHGAWFHVDGACGALGKMSALIAPQLNGIEKADSIAIDFHKWGQVPLDAGFVMVRDSQWHQDTFSFPPAAYLRGENQDIHAAVPWPCDLGPDLSRSFKALKVWFTIYVFGSEQLARMMEHTCELAKYLGSRIAESSELELLAPVSLNIVCFRYRCPDADRVNAEILLAIQKSGIAFPSETKLQGKFAIRAAIFNHRTTKIEMDHLLAASTRLGRTLSEMSGRSDQYNVDG